MKSKHTSRASPVCLLISRCHYTHSTDKRQNQERNETETHKKTRIRETINQTCRMTASGATMRVVFWLISEGRLASMHAIDITVLPRP